MGTALTELTCNRHSGGYAWLVDTEDTHNLTGRRCRCCKYLPRERSSASSMSMVENEWSGVGFAEPGGRPGKRFIVNRFIALSMQRFCRGMRDLLRCEFLMRRLALMGSRDALLLCLFIMPVGRGVLEVIACRLSLNDYGVRMLT